VEERNYNILNKTKQKFRFYSKQAPNLAGRQHGKINKKITSTFSTITDIHEEKFAFLPARDTSLQLLRLTAQATEHFNKRANTANHFVNVSESYDSL
jgi:hypothetical protein